MDHLTFGTVSSILLRGASAIILLLFVIPLQFKQVNVHNGLKKLRKQLLISGITIFIVSVLGIAILFVRLFEPQYQDELAIWLSSLNSFGLLVVATIKYQIYHAQYSPESKAHHKTIEKIEKGEVKVVKKRGRG